MALIDPNHQTTLEIPADPGESVTFRVLSAGDIEDIIEERGKLLPSIMILKALVRWSYPAEITEANVRNLPLDVYNWLTPLVTEAAGIRDAEEKKDSEPPSSPTTDQATDDYQSNSGT